MGPKSSQPRTVTLILNDRCPLQCAHCSLGFSAQHHGSGRKIDESTLRSIISSLDTRYYNMVVLAGGEPSLVPRLVNAAVEACRMAGVISALTTAPVWAYTSEAAGRFLASIAAPDFIILSLDRYHLVALKEEDYGRAIRACLARGIHVALNVCFSSQQERQDMELLITRLPQPIAGIQYSRVMPHGNGSALLEGTSEAIPLMSVDDLNRIPLTCKAGNALINLDTELHACCWSGDVPNSPLRYGTPSDREEAFAAMEGSNLFQKLRLGGLIGSLTYEEREKIVDRLRGARFVNECHLCVTLMKDRRFSMMWQQGDRLASQGVLTVL